MKAAFGHHTYASGTLAAKPLAGLSRRAGWRPSSSTSGGLGNALLKAGMLHPPVLSRPALVARSTNSEQQSPDDPGGAGTAQHRLATSVGAKTIEGPSTRLPVIFNRFAKVITVAS